MRVVYIFAHHDDELGAWPLIRKYVSLGAKQTFIYMTACGEGDIPPMRQRETLSTMQACGVVAPDCRFLGHAHGIPTYHLHEHLQRARDLLREIVIAMAPDALVTHAWEGGHIDHDMGYALTCWLMAQMQSLPEAYQFSLYNMRGLRWPVFRGANPIPENGPVLKARMSAREWLSYFLAVRHHPSQWKVMAPLWPAMMVTFALRRGFYYQRIIPARVNERPHAGLLMYEQTRIADYSEVRTLLQRALLAVP
jgi:LmbE family N-acetylglucosaminyl deacetylase